VSAFQKKLQEPTQLSPSEIRISMKLTRNLSALIALLVFCGPIGVSQTPLRRAVSNQSSQIVSNNGKTELGYMPVYNEGPNRNLFLYATFDDHVVFPEKPVIDIFFISVSDGPKYQHAHDINMQVDGQQFTFGSQDMNFYSTTKGQYIVEGMGFTLTYDSLLHVVNGKNITIRIGATEFQLSRYHLQALHDMANRMKNSH
jgi:hypothetical protein